MACPIRGAAQAHNVGTTKLSLFSCGHIIPQENLMAGVMKTGPSGQPLNFSFKNRSDPAVGARLIKDVGQLIANICNVVPDGVVVQMTSTLFGHHRGAGSRPGCPAPCHTPHAPWGVRHVRPHGGLAC